VGVSLSLSEDFAPAIIVFAGYIVKTNLYELACLFHGLSDLHIEFVVF